MQNNYSPHQAALDITGHKQGGSVLQCTAAQQTFKMKHTCEWMHSSPPLGLTKCICHGPGYDLRTLHTSYLLITFAFQKSFAKPDDACCVTRYLSKQVLPS